MAKKDSEYRALSRDELNQLAGEELPERAAMSLVNANVAIPVNLAAALNVLSDNATAVARRSAARNGNCALGPPLLNGECYRSINQRSTSSRSVRSRPDRRRRWRAGRPVGS